MYNVHVHVPALGLEFAVRTCVSCTGSRVRRAYLRVVYLLLWSWWKFTPKDKRV